MRVPRIFTPQPLAAHSPIELHDAAHHLLDVLRLRPGADIRLFNGDGCEYAGRIGQVDRRTIQVIIGDLIRREPAPDLRFHLLLGISRGERMDYAIQKAVELGVDFLTPVFTERTQVRLDTARTERRLAHWRKIVIHASEQSDRCFLPSIMEPIKLDDASALPNEGIGLLLDHRSEATLDHIARPRVAVHLLVGPEGGLSKRERELMESRGFQSVRLGPRVLRTETAPLVALAAMQMLWGDFRSSSE